MTVSDDDAALYRDEPLDLTTWLVEIGRVLDELNGASPDDAERLLRRSFYLSHLAPPPLWAFIASPRSEAAFERELEDGTPAEAIRAFINRNLVLSATDHHGLVAAVLAAPSWDVAGEWESRDAVLAFVGAWVKCSLALAEKIGANTSAALTARRKSRSSRHLRSTEH